MNKIVKVLENISIIFIVFCGLASILAYLGNNMFPVKFIKFSGIFGYVLAVLWWILALNERREVKKLQKILDIAKMHQHLGHLGDDYIQYLRDEII